jgi:hypothetical protein
MDLTPGQTKLLAYWGNIQSAVSQRASTADLWAAVRGAADAEGVSLAGISVTDMSGLRGLAAGQRNAMDNLQRTSPDQVITGTMIATDLSSRPLADQTLVPSWIVRFEHDVTIDGELVTVWRSSVFDGSLPPTVGDLRDAVNADAEAMATSGSGGLTAESVTHLGVGRMQISAV